MTAGVTAVRSARCLDIGRASMKAGKMDRSWDVTRAGS
jgi:hypothetical protein